MNKTEKKTVPLISLKLGDKFGIEGLDREFQFNGRMQNIVQYGRLGGVMAGKLKGRGRG